MIIEGVSAQKYAKMVYDLAQLDDAKAVILLRSIVEGEPMLADSILDILIDAF